MKLKKEYIKLNPEQRLHHLSVPVIGLTGGIATGKTTVSKMLHQKGLAIINADSLVKEIYSAPETIRFIQKNFPTSVEGGRIQFPILRQLFFNDQKAKDLVEKYIYERLPAAFQKAFENLSKPSIVVYDVPLLFEKGLQNLVDVTVLVYAPRDLQRDRLMNRDHISQELAETILNQQMDIESKRLRSQFIIENLKSETDLLKEVTDFLQKILD